MFFDVKMALIQLEVNLQEAADRTYEQKNK